MSDILAELRRCSVKVALTARGRVVIVRGRVPGRLGGGRRALMRQHGDEILRRLREEGCET